MFLLLFVIFLAACLAAGSTGALFSPGTWYEGLNKPRWTPPNRAFPVAWGTIYLCISAAGAIVAQHDGNGIAMALWALQIALNGLWTPVFFGLKRITAGLMIILALWLTLIASIIAMWQVAPAAGLLFLPYILWISVATALNTEIRRLNPSRGSSEA
ncbi:tryptophan-rich sensory protein TspO [Allosediminivita pacifica]|uniref:TspO/MBR related protein n=1 Tax=Allosediminivita pacifica TaxID=1267769 RepID=A0A2T6B5U1_9RHOB|nr:TspO/MBR family protein [Allosediminivita pacifica]PTX51393.1 TspO/MBR related protein [Allosediminivita pacifica]GGA99476.1 sensory protein TspO [Allosediminivita pacifica]